jgi:hypothetical protein
MSHTVGVMCRNCRTVLIPADPCPERDCPGGHGYTYAHANSQLFIEHNCPPDAL